MIDERVGTATTDVGPDQPAKLVDRFWQLAFRIGFPLATVWWRLRRRPHRGALVAIHVGASVLLLRSSYRAAWNFPGGGVRKGETPQAAARRELAEEIGISVAEPLQPLGTVSGAWEGRDDTVFFFALRLDELPPLRLDHREIVGTRLVPLARLGDVKLTGPVRAYASGRLAGA